jgi:cystathionine gamma-synthase
MSAKKTLLTESVQAGQPEAFAHDALTTPIVQTATYVFENTAALVAYMEGRKEREEYGRYGNPTVRLLETRIASLEGAQDAVVFSSGMAAITSTVFALSQSGTHVILFADCYRRTRQFVRDFLVRFGVSHTLIRDVSELEAAIVPETKLVISEAPTNPYLSVVDIDKMVAICKPRRIRTLIDSTFATPVNLRPLEHGVDLVLHSGTKYLGGHNDVLAGAVAGSSGLVSLVRDVRHMMGAVCDPHAAFLVNRGMKTLGLRVAQQNASAQAIAEMLEAHPKIRRVWYPGLASHPDHDVAARLMSGFGGIVTFEPVADMAAVGRFIDALKIPRIAPSLGGVESLVEQPALMSYFELTTEQRQAVGISDSLVRYAVGIEDTQDLLVDLLQALESL